MSTRLTPYQRRLFVFLSVATFFEGYDFLALANVLPQIRADFGLSKQGAGFMFAFVNFGTVVAWLLIRQADRWGRRPVMMITIVGYTLFTFISGVAPNVWVFATAQFLARIFLIGEWATSMVYAAEEYPDDKRGTVIGVIQACSSLGAVFCAGITPILLGSAYGWRSVYLVGVIPLIVLAFARRNLKETQRFEQRKLQGADASTSGGLGLFELLRSPHFTRVCQLGLIWFLTYICSQTGISFWKEYAISDVGLSDAEVGKALVLASLISMPLVFAAGKMLDVIGRRAGAVIIYLATAGGAYFAYSLETPLALTIALTAAIFGASAVLSVLNAFSTELFPTSVRADAFGWANNLLGRIGYVLAPIAVGWAAEQWGWGAAIRPTAIFPLIGLALILLWLPETKNRSLDTEAGA